MTFLQSTSHNFIFEIHSKKYEENEPHRNRIGKVYISHSPERNLNSGDVVLIYRIGETIPKRYSSTVTTICIVENTKDGFTDFEEFYSFCKHRTMISKVDLHDKWWNKFPNYRPFIINFLFAHSFPTPKPTLDDLIKLKIFKDALSIPRGFAKLTTSQFDDVLRFAFRKKK